MINLKPETVWSYFKDISAIPRCSGNEDEVREYILDLAKAHELRARVDGVGNVLVSDEAGSSGGSPPLVLQAHMDMVCERNSDVDHDFQTDPIRLKEDEGWITAEGTTLGADNGIGMAIALALATGDFDFKPLDYLFTVDEERGLNGAANLDPEFLRADGLINLDSEEFGVFTIGCAGGGKTVIDLPVAEMERVEGRVMRVSVTGLTGGHSGEDIDRGRANAIKLLGRLLGSPMEGLSPRIIEISGGDKHNAIPREGEVVLFVDDDYSRWKRVLRDRFSTLSGEYEETEPGMKLHLEELSEGGKGRAADEETSRYLLHLIQALPNGVMGYDQRLESTVETSTNLASVRLKDGAYRLTMSSRSSRESKLAQIRRRIELIAESFGGEVTQEEAYPPWQPERGSRLLGRSKEVFEDLYGKAPEVKVTHGGLETGLIGDLVPGLDMISMGPDIESPHSPGERLKIESVRDFWEFLLALLGELVESQEG